MPQLFVVIVDSASEKHHTVITIDGDDLVVIYSLPIHQYHEEISNTHPVVPFTGVRVATRGGVLVQRAARCISGVSLAIQLL